MRGSWTTSFLCGLLATTLVGATFSPPAVLSLGPQAIKEQLTQKLEYHNATAILQQLPLLSTMRERPTGGIPLLGSLVSSILNYIIWLKVTSANIPRVQVQPAVYDQELMVRIPMEMVAGFNTPLVKTIVQFHMETEAQAFIRVESTNSGPGQPVLSDCSTSDSSLNIRLLHKLSFFVNTLANKVQNLLMPALPKLIKSQLCPVIEAAFNDMYADLVRLVKVTIPLNPGGLKFDLLSSTMEDGVIQLNLEAEVLDSQAKVIKSFNNSDMSLYIPPLGSTPFSLAMREDVVNAVVAALLPPEKFLILLSYVLPSLSYELKSSLRNISKMAADKLDQTQIVKIVTQDTPDVHLGFRDAEAAQQIILEVFATNKDLRPFFTLGIEANSEVQFYTEGDQLKLNFSDISFDRIKLMISDIGLFNPDLLRDIITKILTTELLPNQNGGFLCAPLPWPFSPVGPQ
ncbi:BPI fold-containing family B member 1 [Ctenodactylus gundi]